MDSKIAIGGQALIEGVMMRSKDRYAMSVRGPDKKISTKIIKIKDRWYNRIPIIRGITRFAETISIGIRSLSYSANISTGEEDNFSTAEMVFTVVLSLGMTVLLFYAAPLFLARFITESRGVLFNVIDGIVRILIFLGYLLVISLLPDIKRIFQYHGAEHMTVHAYEQGEKLTVKNVKKYTTLHPRCGTNFILIVFVLSIIFFTFVHVEGYFSRLGARLLLLPVIAGVSYEFLRFAGKYYENPLVKVIVFPGLFLQNITTRKPDDSMIEVAIKALKAAVKPAQASS
jgi:uncharacterized protein YqhQ